MENEINILLIFGIVSLIVVCVGLIGFLLSMYLKNTKGKVIFMCLAIFFLGFSLFSLGFAFREINFALENGFEFKIWLLLLR